MLLILLIVFNNFLLYSPHVINFVIVENSNITCDSPVLCLSKNIFTFCSMFGDVPIVLNTTFTCPDGYTCNKTTKEPCVWQEELSSRNNQLESFNYIEYDNQKPENEDTLEILNYTETNDYTDEGSGLDQLDLHLFETTTDNVDFTTSLAENEENIYINGDHVSPESSFVTTEQSTNKANYNLDMHTNDISEDFLTEESTKPEYTVIDEVPSTVTTKQSTNTDDYHHLHIDLHANDISEDFIPTEESTKSEYNTVVDSVPSTVITGIQYTYTEDNLKEITTKPYHYDDLHDSNTSEDASTTEESMESEYNVVDNENASTETTETHLTNTEENLKEDTTKTDHYEDLHFDLHTNDISEDYITTEESTKSEYNTVIVEDPSTVTTGIQSTNSEDILKEVTTKTYHYDDIQLDLHANGIFEDVITTEESIKPEYNIVNNQSASAVTTEIHSTNTEDNLIEDTMKTEQSTNTELITTQKTMKTEYSTEYDEVPSTVPVTTDNYGDLHSSDISNDFVTTVLSTKPEYKFPSTITTEKQSINTEINMQEETLNMEITNQIETTTASLQQSTFIDNYENFHLDDYASDHFTRAVTTEASTEFNSVGNEFPSTVTTGEQSTNTEENIEQETTSPKIEMNNSDYFDVVSDVLSTEESMKTKYSTVDEDFLSTVNTGEELTNTDNADENTSTIPNTLLSNEVETNETATSLNDFPDSSGANNTVTLATEDNMIDDQQYNIYKEANEGTSMDSITEENKFVTESSLSNEITITEKQNNLDTENINFKYGTNIVSETTEASTTFEQTSLNEVTGNYENDETIVTDLDEQNNLINVPTTLKTVTELETTTMSNPVKTIITEIIASVSCSESTEPAVTEKLKIQQTNDKDEDDGVKNVNATTENVNYAIIDNQVILVEDESDGNQDLYEDLSSENDANGEKPGADEATDSAEYVYSDELNEADTSSENFNKTEKPDVDQEKDSAEYGYSDELNEADTSSENVNKTEKPVVSQETDSSEYVYSDESDESSESHLKTTRKMSDTTPQYLQVESEETSDETNNVKEPTVENESSEYVSIISSESELYDYEVEPNEALVTNKTSTHITGADSSESESNDDESSNSDENPTPQQYNKNEDSSEYEEVTTIKIVSLSTNPGNSSEEADETTENEINLSHEDTKPTTITPLETIVDYKEYGNEEFYNSDMTTEIKKSTTKESLIIKGGEPEEYYYYYEEDQSEENETSSASSDKPNYVSTLIPPSTMSTTLLPPSTMSTTTMSTTTLSTTMSTTKIDPIVSTNANSNKIINVFELSTTTPPRWQDVILAMANLSSTTEKTTLNSTHKIENYIALMNSSTSPINLATTPSTQVNSVEALTMSSSTTKKTTLTWQNYILSLTNASTTSSNLAATPSTTIHSPGYLSILSNLVKGSTPSQSTHKYKPVTLKTTTTSSSVAVQSPCLEKITQVTGQMVTQKDEETTHVPVQVQAATTQQSTTKTMSNPNTVENSTTVSQSCNPGTKQKLSGAPCNEYRICLKVMWWSQWLVKNCESGHSFSMTYQICVPDDSCKV